MGCGGSSEAAPKRLTKMDLLRDIIKDDRPNIKTKVYENWTSKKGASMQGVSLETWAEFCKTTHECAEADKGLVPFDEEHFMEWAKRGNDPDSGPGPMVEPDNQGEWTFRFEHCCLWIAEVAWMSTEKSQSWIMIEKDLKKDAGEGELDPAVRRDALMKEVNKKIETVVGEYAATADDPGRKPRDVGLIEKGGNMLKGGIDKLVAKTA